MSNLIDTKNSFLARLVLACLIASAGGAHTALAQQDNTGAFFGQHAKGKWIIGGKAAKIDANSEFVDDADASGVMLGYEFARPIGDLGGSAALELEYVNGDETIINGLGNYEADVVNVFMAYRSAGALYFKAKAGMSFSDLTINTPTSNDTFDETSFAAGIGLGYRLGEYGAIEVEYTDDTGDNDLGILGLNAFLQF
ncbi:MAG: porin family protein [Arenicella sp.]|nr:porin family protein [Arenicella sp.]